MALREDSGTAPHFVAARQSLLGGGGLARPPVRMLKALLSGLQMQAAPLAFLDGRAVPAALVLTLALVGCGSAGTPVALTTAPPSMIGAGCYTDSALGELVPDPKYGTAIEDTTTMNGGVPVLAPVVWRPGYTASRVNEQVVVRDANGNVVATTGRAYRIEGGYVGGGQDWPQMPDRVFLACGYITPQ